MVDLTPPKGQRFSHVYLERGRPSNDSKRMRIRLGKLCELRVGHPMLDHLISELGVDVPGDYDGTVYWVRHFEECELSDALDTITLVARIIAGTAIEKVYRAEVQRIFDEENVNYAIDDSGGVQFRVDEEFERNRVSALAALGGARYDNARAAFESVQQELRGNPPDGKGAIRDIFSAVECLFRLIVPKAPRLDTKGASELEPIISRWAGGSAAAQGAGTKMLSSFKDWIDAAHFYRHEPGTEEVAQPPLDLTVHMVSVGASHLRWLAELDESSRQV